MDTIFSKLSITDLWLKIVITFAVCILVGLVLQLVVFYLLKTYNKKKPTVLKTQLLKHLETPVKLLLPILFIYSSFGLFMITNFWHIAIEVIIILNFSWVLLAIISAVEEIVRQKFITNSNLIAKELKAITQMRFIKKVSIVVIVTLARATILWNILTIRTLVQPYLPLLVLLVLLQMLLLKNPSPTLLQVCK